VKIKHIVLGFFGALFVTTLIFQAPILAWAQNTTLWYGSQGGKVWTLASGGTITANSGSAVTLAGTNTLSGTNTISGATTITNTVSLSKLLTLTGGVTSSGPLFQHSGVTNLTGGFKTTGADTLDSSTLTINPFITYSKCGVVAVEADSSTKTFAVTGLVATDAVFAMTAEDTANAVIRAFVDTPGSLKIVVAGAVTADNTDGMKVSWFAIRPQ